MGFCVDDDERFDVFLSYSRDDDDYHNQWVSDFERYLKQKVVAQLKRKSGEYRDCAQEFSVCRDETGFPASGDLESVIDDKVRGSQFLFIFLGQGYLNSTWCLSELDTFRDTAGGSFKDAARRLYLIVLDREAVDTLNEGEVPEHLPDKRKKLWRDLQSLSRSAIRIEDFLQDDQLVPVFRSGNRADPDFHQACTRLVDEIGDKLIGCRGQHIKQPSRPSGEGHVVVGAVPHRLSPARDRLVDALNDPELRIVEEADLGQPARLRELLKDSRLLLQPFDNYQPLVKRGDPPGGHLAVQRELFVELHGDGASGAACAELWWQPSDGGLEVGDQLDRYDEQFISTLPKDCKRHCSTAELVSELRGPESTAAVVARVWVEWDESDQDTIDEAKGIVYQFFSEYRDAQEKAGRKLSAKLEFGDADWWNLEQELGSTPDGVVIVYNENKDRKALKEQEQTISDLEAVLLKKTFPGMFYMRKKGIYKPPRWSVVRFKSEDHTIDYDPKEVGTFVENLFEVLWRNHHD